ncbi:DUF4240 domain-containing protein [Streptomyces sp. JV178]|uniref:DUF4240 domain-containing protein n=1 Tax=Streptomyces sp. JV178 TaxID=858632 RepID=UPI00211DF11E|nr:DUF4240 domain-containing protein [Streptomyces sp. JV178]
MAAQQILWDLLGTSYRAPLWAAAFTINGGCSDDGFDYVRGWLVLQGHEVFERAVADPDSLARSPVIRRASRTGPRSSARAPSASPGTPTARPPGRICPRTASASATRRWTRRGRRLRRLGGRRSADCPAWPPCTRDTGRRDHRPAPGAVGARCRGRVRPGC